MRKLFSLVRLSLVVWMAMGVGGCVKRDASGDDHGDADQAMRFSVSTVESRAVVTGSDFQKEGTTFSVWGNYWAFSGSSRVPINVFNATPVRYDGTSWGYEDTRYWFPGFSYNFRALYPVDLEGVTFDENAVLLSIGEYDGSKRQDDILYAAPEEIKAVQGPMPVVALDFRHVLSRIVFEGTKVPGLDDEVVVTSVKLYGVRVKGTWKGTAGEPCGTWTAGEDLAIADAPYASGPQRDVTITENGTFARVLEVLMIPQRIPVEAVLEITYRDGEGEHTSLAELNIVSGSLGWEWKPGATYRYRFTIGESDLIRFDMPEVTPWSDVDGGNYIIQ